MLPIFKDESRNFMQMQTKWASELNSLLAKEFLQGQLIQATLVTGVNIINHLLARKQIGWVITDTDAAVTVYRSQPLDDKTLTLTSTGSANVSIWVF